MPPKRILVVDDDNAILRLLLALFRRENYKVDTAAGGKDALSKIARTLYDVIVLDLMMPEVSGLDVLRSLEARIPHVKCVVILSAASSFDVATSINSNVFAALRKPFDNTALVTAVRECIESNCGAAGPALPIHVVEVVAAIAA